MEGVIKMRPWGGSGGSKWSQCGDSTVRKIVIAHGGAIDSITFLTSSDGREKMSKRNGQKGGSSKDEIRIRNPDEYMTSISGHIGNYGGYKVLQSLTFCTNFKKYGPYGCKEGARFSIPIYGGVIVGFHGRAGRYMDAIGIFVKPIGLISSTNSDMKICRAVPGTPLASPSVEVAEREISRPLTTAWGGVGGKPWDDGVFSGIKRIYIHIDGCTVINGIEVVYKSWGSDDEISCIHGSSYGFTACGIELDDKEHLVSVSGFYGTAKGSSKFEVIKSLTFYTNKAKYGPIGAEEVGKYFSTSYSSSLSCEIVGFFGRAGCYLDAIGVHMRYY